MKKTLLLLIALFFAKPALSYIDIEASIVSKNLDSDCRISSTEIRRSELIVPKENGQNQYFYFLSAPFEVPEHKSISLSDYRYLRKLSISPALPENCYFLKVSGKNQKYTNLNFQFIGKSCADYIESLFQTESSITLEMKQSRPNKRYRIHFLRAKNICQ